MPCLLLSSTKAERTKLTAHTAKVQLAGCTPRLAGQTGDGSAARRLDGSTSRLRSPLKSTTESVETDSLRPAVMWQILEMTLMYRSHEPLLREASRSVILRAEEVTGSECLKCLDEHASLDGIAQRSVEAQLFTTRVFFFFAERDAPDTSGGTPQLRGEHTGRDPTGTNSAPASHCTPPDNVNPGRQNY